MPKKYKKLSEAKLKKMSVSALKERQQKIAAAEREEKQKAALIKKMRK